MKMLRVIDKYDSWKIWVIKLYKGGAVYFNQECHGVMTNHKFVRTTKKYLTNLLEEDINKIIKDYEEKKEEEKEDCRSKEEIAYRDNFISKCMRHEESIINEADIF